MTRNAFGNLGTVREGPIVGGLRVEHVPETKLVCKWTLERVLRPERVVKWTNGDGNTRRESRAVARASPDFGTDPPRERGIDRSRGPPEFAPGRSRGGGVFFQHL